MRAHAFLTFLPLGASLFALAIAGVGAQPVAMATVCLDGAQITSRDPRVCNTHGGVDGRATQVARRAMYDGGLYGTARGQGPHATEKYAGSGSVHGPTIKYGGTYNGSPYNDSPNNGGTYSRGTDDGTWNRGGHERTDDREHADGRRADAWKSRAPQVDRHGRPAGRREDHGAH